ncbi:MAG: BlaI/MecI/CopY family transcriptional regulator, partial [Planctomycetota bacterium]|nr:BlaI/MecI/CopY family transcriptional regulator [Planctomycetota bacterium]
KRRKDQGKFRYAAARKQEAVEMQLASEFVDEFFAGSAANLVMSLLGSQQIPPDDIERLKQLLNQKTPGSNQPKGKSP